MDNYPEISNIRKSIKSHYPVSDESIGLLCLYHNRAGFEYVETIEPTLAYSIPISILNELYETTSKLPIGEESSTRNACCRCNAYG